MQARVTRCWVGVSVWWVGIKVRVFIELASRRVGQAESREQFELAVGFVQVYEGGPDLVGFGAVAEDEEEAVEVTAGLGEGEGSSEGDGFGEEELFF